MKNHFEINELEFARTKKDVTPSTKGFFVKVKGGIKLLNLDKEPMALVCTNESSPFIVTAFRFEKQTRYMYCTTVKTERFLGIEGLGYAASRNVAEEAVSNFLA